MSGESWHNLMLSEEQEMIRETARKFAEDVLAPIAEEIDRASRFPKDTFGQMAELGFLGLPVDDTIGGAGMGHLAYAIALEEFARVCASTAWTLASHLSLCTNLIASAGSPEQREAFVGPLASGEVFGAFALTEREAGSDAASIATTARVDGDDYVIDGSKAYVTNANIAGTFVVIARTDADPEAGAKGLSAFIVAADSAGMTIEPGPEKLGMRAADWGHVRFDGVRVPAANRIGAEGEGFVIAMQAIDAGRVALAAIALGIGQGALERATQYSQERIAFGKPLVKQQAVLFKLANMQIQLAASRHLVYHAARLQEAGGEVRPADAAIAKITASECAMRCTDEAIQIHGGYGYVSEYAVERMYRDAKFCEIGEGTNEICRMVVGRSLLDSQ